MNNRTARQRILDRLYASGTEHTTVPEAPPPPMASLDREGRIERLADLMAAIRTEKKLGILSKSSPS